MPRFIPFLGVLAVCALASRPGIAAAEDAKGGGEQKEETKSATETSTEEDFSETPFTEYAEFNEEEEEARVAKYFQYGRFYGLSLGAGVHGVDGNRGLLWQGGFPLITIRLHYWFDFNLGLNLGFYTTSHFYEKANERFDVSFIHVGIDLKYYFDVRDLSAAISFANPYILFGGGNFSKTESSLLDETVDPDNAFGFVFGGGFEFAISPRKSYFYVEFKYAFARFKDTLTAEFIDVGIDDLTGQFYSVSTGIMLTY